MMAKMYFNQFHAVLVGILKTLIAQHVLNQRVKPHNSLRITHEVHSERCEINTKSCYSLRFYLRREFPLSTDSYAGLLAAQERVCPLAQRPPPC